MKYLIALLCLTSSVAYAQLTIDSAKALVQEYRLGYLSEFDAFTGQPSYGAPVILTNDGGAAAFGDNTLYKLDKRGKEQWKRETKVQFDEQECQSVAQDTKGNLYVFMMAYDSKRYRGGSNRVVCFDKTGKLLWDKTLGAYALMNNPIVAYIRSLKDGRIYMRGHVVKDKPVEGKDPIYRYWEGWIDSTGKLTQKAGEVIDWGKGEWQKKFKPEESVATKN
jgi:hypothetical protein